MIIGLLLFSHITTLGYHLPSFWILYLLSSIGLVEIKFSTLDIDLFQFHLVNSTRFSIP